MRPTEGGNLGARPKPPQRASKSARYWASAVFSSWTAHRRPGRGTRALAQVARQLRALVARAHALSLRPEVGDADRAACGSRAGRAGPRAGSRCPAKNGSWSGVRNTVIGQPPCPWFMARVAAM